MFVSHSIKHVSRQLICFKSTGTTNHYYIYPNEKHWNFFFAIADLNVTIPNELEHHGVELVYPDLSDLSL